MDYTFVALYEGKPVAVAHTMKDLELLLEKYTQGTLVEYKAYNPKYPDDFQGWYYYDEHDTNEVMEFKVYTVDYLGEDRKPELSDAFKAGWLRANAMTYDESYFEYYWKNEYKK